ncbi:hypothetical protein ACFQYP_40415 [Nonomuraea antimicrobica]
MRVITFEEPGEVRVGLESPAELVAGAVRVRTLYSGVSAGTELTAYRGTNPYLNRKWDTERRLFVEGQTHAYPLAGWGYQEVGEVVEAAPDVADPRSAASCGASGATGPRPSSPPTSSSGT